MDEVGTSLVELSPAARHYQESLHIPVPPLQVFAHIDDHARLSAHMGRASWMMAGGRMDTHVDAGQGRAVGSHIRLSGRVLGIRLFLDEVVTVHEPPYRIVWQTVGPLQLLIIGHYRMGVEIVPEGDGSRLRVFIDYDLPTPASTRWLGYLLGGTYARWCVRQMLRSARAVAELPR